jgi:type IX secretion system PorP/SprF family membrane protein
MVRRYAVVLGACVAVLLAAAQDAHYTQFYAVPTYLSPAFAGTSAATRIGLTARDQWPTFPGAFISSNIAFDQYLSDLNSGVGMIVQHDRAGSGALSYTSVTMQYAYEIELKRKVFLRPALQFGYVNHSVDWGKLMFGDQLTRGGDVATYANYQGRTANYTDIGTGLLFFTPQLWLGASVLHLTEPEQSLLGGFSPVPRQFNAHGGYRFKLKGPVIKKHAQSVVAAFNYRAQGKYDQLDIGAYFERDPLFAGIWYRGLPVVKAYQPGYLNNDAIAFLMGYTYGNARFGYSYDVTISRLALNTGGSHEITAVFDIANRRQRKSMSKRRIVPCAKF